MKDDYNNWSVIRQKGESQNGCFKKTARQIFWKTDISYSLPDRHTYVRVPVRG